MTKAALAVAVAVSLAPGAARAFSLESYGPAMWGAGDDKLGFAKATVVDFETTTLPAGFATGVTVADPAASTLVGQLPATFDPTTDAFGKAFAEGAWDGTHVLIDTTDNQSHPYSSGALWGRVSFLFENGATRVGFSLTDVELANTLYVNGAPFGVIGTARGTTNIELMSSKRNGYLVVVAGPGEVIHSVAIDNRQNGDGWAIDHLLYEGLPAATDAGVDVPPPAPSRVAMLLLTDDDANLLYEYTITPTGDPKVAAIVPAPSANNVALGPTGELFVGDFNGGGVSRFLSPFGRAQANGHLTAPGLTYPEQLAFVGGELWVLGSDLAASTQTVPIVRFGFDDKGNATPVGSITDGLVGADRGMLWDAATSDLYVSQCCAASQVLHFHLEADGTLTQLTPLKSPDLSNAHGMVITPGRELLVASYDNSTIVRFKLDVEGQGTQVGTVTGNGLGEPVGLALAPWGELWVASQANGALSRFLIDDATGDVTANGSFPRSSSPPASRTGWIQIVEAPVACAPPTAPACAAMQPPPVEAPLDAAVTAPVDAGADAREDVPAPEDAPAPTVDAQVTDAARDAASAKSSSGCGCRAEDGASGGGALALLLAALILTRTRRAA